MNVKELRAKLERFDKLKEVTIHYEGYVTTPVLDVYEDEHGRVVLSEDMERDDAVNKERAV